MKILGFINKNQIGLAFIAQMIIMFALIRCSAECCRLFVQSEDYSGMIRLKPFLLGTFFCTLSVLFMLVLNFSKYYKLVILTSILTVVTLTLIKLFYM